MSLIDQLATESITIQYDGERQIVKRANVQSKKIFIPGNQFKEKNVYEIKIKVGDTIEHKNKAGITEKYEVTNVIYIDKDHMFGEPHIQVGIKNLTELKSSSHKQVINGVYAGGNINVGGSFLNNSTVSAVSYDTLDEELKLKLEELRQAVESKDKFKINSIFSFILDKSFDLAVALLAGQLMK